MMTYFKPLRRKIGVLTLVMACVFAAGWVRSCYRADIFYWDNQSTILTVSSIDQRFGTVFQMNDAPFTWQWPELSIDVVIPPSDNTNDSELLLNWHAAGIYLGGDKGIYAVGLNYPWIVITLAALSAWLLLSKPRADREKIDSIRVSADTAPESYDEMENTDADNF